MQLRLTRYYYDEESTLGMLAINKDGEGSEGAKWQCYTLEDEVREEKIKHQTAIWEGEYEIGFMEKMTPMTKKYQEKYPWFKWHLHIKDVPGFTSIYIHIGNDEGDTSGCVLVGYTSQVDKLGFRDQILSSTNAYKDLYLTVSEALNRGERVTINIKNIYR